jgi:hypothetical protein
VDEFFKDVYKKKIFGEVLAHMMSTEFQKRTLPHTHTVLCLHPDCKLRTPEDVDSLISAEFPDKEKEPELYALVLKCMVHNPCGERDPRAPCMKDGKCSKGFPKPFRDVTTLSENSYAVYRRRNDGRVHTTSRGAEVDNRWVVPYNPYLLWKFRCHINVESVYSIKSVKYIYKYIYKGHDRTTMEFGTCQNEVKQFLDARWLGSCEGVWRLYQFLMHSEKPNVIRLQVHLPDQQLVIFEEDEENMDEVAERAAQKDTTLTAFFKANEKYPEARELLYQDIPQHFTLDRKKMQWKLRVQNRFALGRMFYAHPSSGERFYLRLLLTVVKGATSFEDLLTVNGIQLPTFKQACIHLGLLEDDGEWIQCLEEAKHMQSGHQLRSLFVTILAACDPTEPAVLWERFKENICDDLHRTLQRKGINNPTVDQVYDYGLYLIEQTLERQNKSLKDFPPMPLPQGNWNQRFGNHLINEQLDYDHIQQFEEAEERKMMFNADQQAAFDEIMAAVESKSGQCFFLHGPGGTGKTFVYNTLCCALRAQGKIVICVASSGIAALILIGGRTSHFRLKIPIEIHEKSTCSIKKNSLEAELM